MVSRLKDKANKHDLFPTAPEGNIRAVRHGSVLVTYTPCSVTHTVLRFKPQCRLGNLKIGAWSKWTVAIKGVSVYYANLEQ